jgi:ATP-dependent DNA helicase RecG
MNENKNIDKKSLKFLREERQTDWNELAKDCVSFANAQGGFILIGIENNEKLPPENQKITDKNLPDVIQKNIAQRSVNVGVAVTIETASNKAEYIKVQVFRNAQILASTTDGKYYVRVHDECRPIPPDEMARLAADKNAFVWEEQTTKKIPVSQFDEQKRADFLREIRNSNRVSSFIK